MCVTCLPYTSQLNGRSTRVDSGSRYFSWSSKVHIFASIYFIPGLPTSRMANALIVLLPVPALASGATAGEKLRSPRQCWDVWHKLGLTGLTWYGYFINSFKIMAQCNRGASDRCGQENRSRTVARIWELPWVAEPLLRSMYPSKCRSG